MFVKLDKFSEKGNVQITPGSELFIISIHEVKDNNAERREDEFIGDYVFCDS